MAGFVKSKGLVSIATGYSGGNYEFFIRLECDRDSLVVVPFRKRKGGNANEYYGSLNTFIGCLCGIVLHR